MKVKNTDRSCNQDKLLCRNIFILLFAFFPLIFLTFSCATTSNGGSKEKKPVAEKNLKSHIERIFDEIEKLRIKNIEMHNQISLIHDSLTSISAIDEIVKAIKRELLNVGAEKVGIGTTEIYFRDVNPDLVRVMKRVGLIGTATEIIKIFIIIHEEYKFVRLRKDLAVELEPYIKSKLYDSIYILFEAKKDLFKSKAEYEEREKIIEYHRLEEVRQIRELNSIIQRYLTLSE